MKFILIDHRKETYKILTQKEASTLYKNIQNPTKSQIDNFESIGQIIHQNQLTPDGKGWAYSYYNRSLFVHTANKEFLIKSYNKIAQKFFPPRGGYVNKLQPYHLKEGNWGVSVTVGSGMTSSDVVNSYSIDGVYYKGERLLNFPYSKNGLRLVK